MILLCLFVLSSLFRPLIYHMGKMRHAWRLEKAYQPSEQVRVYPVRFNLLFTEFLSLTIPLFPSRRKLQRNLQKPNPTQRKFKYPSINHMEKSSKPTPTMLKSWAWWYDLFYGILHATRLQEQVREK